MTTKQVTTTSVEQQLFSKKAINLPPRERIALLLNIKRYPIVRKSISAKAQIEEMIDLYNICCLMLTHYFPNEQSTSNFLLINFLSSEESSNSIANKQLAKAFRMLNCYEELEHKVSAIQLLFYQYQSAFPEVYELYNLDDIVNEKMSDIIERTRRLIRDNPSYIKELIERLGIL